MGGKNENFNKYKFNQFNNKYSFNNFRFNFNKKISSNHKKCIKIIKEQKIKMDFLKNELNDMEEEILLS